MCNALYTVQNSKFQHNRIHMRTATSQANANKNAHIDEILTWPSKWVIWNINFMHNSQTFTGNNKI